MYGNTSLEQIRYESSMPNAFFVVELGMTIPLAFAVLVVMAMIQSLVTTTSDFELPVVIEIVEGNCFLLDTSE